MGQILTSALLAVPLFVATNLDDIFLLVVFFSSGKYKTANVIVGQYLGIAALILASLTLSSIAYVIPKDWLGILGIAPIALGFRELWRRNSHDSEEVEERQGSGFASVAAVTIANGSDNIASYVPVFAVRAWNEKLVIVLVFGVLTGLWCWGARAIVKHPKLGPPLRRFGSILLPWVLIGIGGQVLWTSGAAIRHVMGR